MTFPIVMILTICCFVLAALFASQQAMILLIGMLFLPFIDRGWNFPLIRFQNHNLLSWGVCSGFILVIYHLNPGVINTVLVVIFLVALPEEWFFRAYLLSRLQLLLPVHPVKANIICSIAFSLAHAIPRGTGVAIEVFLPSLFLGWLYQKTNDLILCILVHAIANIIFILYLNQYFSDLRTFFGYSI